MNRQQIENRIAELTGNTSGRLAKYTRNFRRYNYTLYAGLDNIREPSLVGYNQISPNDEADTLPSPQINVIKSIIDTLTSKIAQSKVRPYFTTINGGYKDFKIVKQAQHFFDLFFDEQKVHRLVPEIFRDACIFDTGWAFVDADRKGIFRLLPHQVYFRPAEMNYGKMTRCYIEQKDFPTTLLPLGLDSKFRNDEYLTVGIYFDINLKRKIYRINGKLFEYEFDSETLPICPLHYESPIVGCYSQSIVDVLNSIQIQIDDISAKICEASQLNPANTICVPETSNIKVQQLSNRIGNVLFYRPSPDIGNNPVTVATPSFIDGSYQQQLESLINRAYEMVGVSQLSAQSKKPRGLDAGKALLTLEDVESERFEQQLNSVIKFYVNLAKICIDVFPKGDFILPPSRYRSPMKWGEVKAATDFMTLQFSGADVLSKDPSQKLQELQSLAQAGIIPATMVGRYLEIPDLESGYSLATNATDAVDGVIQNCIENDNFEVPDFIPFLLLKEAIINTQLQLQASNPERNKKDIEKLDRLYSQIEKREENFNAEIQQETEAANNELGIQTGSVLQQQAQTVEQGTPNSQSVPDAKAVEMPTANSPPAGWGDNLAQ